MIHSIISMCMFYEKYFYKALTKCCEDPVIHERITKDIKDWIKVKAPGTKDTKGCSKKFHFPNFQSEKGIKSKIENHILNYSFLSFVVISSPKM